MAKHGKRYNEALETVGKVEAMEPSEAMALIKKAATAKFDETIDVAIRLGVDPRHGDQMVRGTTNLPFGTGKVRKVAVITKGDNIAAAEEAGADKVGAEDLIKDIQGGWMDFDVLLATPDVMNLVGRLGSILRAKMPSKKAGTVAEDIAQVVKEIKTASRVEFRVEKAAIVHAPIGKASFTEEQLTANFAALMTALSKAKPASAKGRYFRKISVSSTMGPSVQIDTAAATKLITKK